MKPYKLLGPAGIYESVTPGTLGGNGHAKIYGRLDCPSAVRAVKAGDTYQKHRVFFKDKDTAVKCGYPSPPARTDPGVPVRPGPPPLRRTGAPPGLG
jgi:hypothetical protein